MTEDECRQDSIQLMTILTDKGYMVDKEKLRYSQEEVLYIGHLISHEGKKVTPERSEEIMKTTKPNTVKQMQQFLGLCNYDRAWVCDIHKTSLQALKKAQMDKVTIEWTETLEEGFDELKKAICTVPVLGVPN
ncbi:uncharacterized protein [Ambystoma mexicanum]|uniref:uncharacterized protein n=1 Tax=Ambystoma mexicanum TaxID=8296 RepID=UPI0037E80CD1